jgi:type II secretory pathway pseudopilin PulG
MHNPAKITDPQNGPFQAHTRDPAFTLIELMMVLMTIAMLVLLVVPALARSSDQAGRTVCANNLRQLGMASNMYAGDNRDYLAYPNWGNAAGWQGWLYTYNNGIPDPGPYGSYENSQVAAYNTGLWFRYVKDINVYLCPVDIESRTYSGGPFSGSVRLQRLSSYVMNGAVCGYSQIYRTAKISDAWNPGCYLLWNPDENYLGLGSPGAFDYNDGSNFPGQSEGIDCLHTSNGGLVLTIGGDVHFVCRTTFRAESAAQGKSLIWWNPFSSTGH